MRRPSNNTELATDALGQLHQDVKQELGNTRFFNILRAVLSTLDLAGAGHDIYLTVGTTRNKSAFVISVTWDGDKFSVYGNSAAELALKLEDLLAD